MSRLKIEFRRNNWNYVLFPHGHRGLEISTTCAHHMEGVKGGRSYNFTQKGSPQILALNAYHTLRTLLAAEVGAPF